MLKKIISGGQTGADRAALDIAIKFNIDHGGWVPAGRRAEDGPVPEKYHLSEMATPGYPQRTEQNVKDSQGTLIFSRGALSGGSLLTLKIAEKLGKMCYHIDLLQMDEFEAAVLVHGFVADNAIEVLNVAGSRASQDPTIHRTVSSVLETFLYMELMETTPELLRADDIFSVKGDFARGNGSENCTTVDGAVRFLAEIIPLRTRSIIANSRSSEISSLYFSMADFIRAELGLDSGNRALFEACKGAEIDQAPMDIEDAVMLLLKSLRFFLKKDHLLRVVK